MEGVYKITNISSGSSYVGSSKRLKHRIGQHISNYRGGYGESKMLQEDWNIFGESSFKFEVIELCKDYKEREQFYIDLIKPVYNTYLSAHSPLGHKHSEHTKQKISKSNMKKKSVSKISESSIKEIISLYETKKYKQKELAEMFETNQGYISHIVNKNRRKYIG